jgi:hypothetical protein
LEEKREQKKEGKEKVRRKPCLWNPSNILHFKVLSMPKTILWDIIFWVPKLHRFHKDSTFAPEWKAQSLHNGFSVRCLCEGLLKPSLFFPHYTSVVVDRPPPKHISVTHCFGYFVYTSMSPTRMRASWRVRAHFLPPVSSIKLTLKGKVLLNL